VQELTANLHRKTTFVCFRLRQTVNSPGKDEKGLDDVFFSIEFEMQTQKPVLFAQFA
jgi:hypothetical protein